MKKQLLTMLAIGTVSGSLFAQLPVSTSPQNRKAVLEEFTGIHCQYCPDGHKIAQQVEAANAPGDVMLVNIHTGNYAVPNAGEPDYRTNEGAAILAMPGMGLTGYPKASVERSISGRLRVSREFPCGVGHPHDSDIPFRSSGWRPTVFQLPPDPA